jgi:hypothetical protein
MPRNDNTLTVLRSGEASLDEQSRYDSVVQPPEVLYLELIKRALSFTLWPEPPMPVETFNYLRPAHIRWPLQLASSILKRTRLQLVRIPDATEEERDEGKTWPGYADTMIGRKRLDDIQLCVETVLREKIPGDLIEAGVWRGGASIFMRAVLAAHGVFDRRVYVADSFEGLPEPDDAKYPADRGDTLHIHPYLAVSQEEVGRNFARYGLLDDQVVFLKGWFKDTLPSAPIERLAIMRLDGDMYESTMDGLTSLYPKLSPGGFCIIDDYALDGCRMAVDDFRRAHAISSELHAVDWTGRHWRKEG